MTVEAEKIIMSELKAIRRMLEVDKSEWVNTKVACDLVGVSNPWLLTEMRRLLIIKTTRKVKNRIEYNRAELKEVKARWENGEFTIKGLAIIKN